MSLQVMFLRQMELARNRIGRRGALALVEALQQAPLVSLGLVENGLSDETVACMMQRKPKMSVLHTTLIDTHASSVRIACYTHARSAFVLVLVLLAVFVLLFHITS